MRGEPSASGRKRFRSNRPCVAAVAAAGILVLTACGPGSPGKTTQSASHIQSPSTTPSATASPMARKPFTDQELMAFTNAVLAGHGGRSEDTAQVRKSYALQPSPPPMSVMHPAQPSECAAFHTPWQHEAQLNPSMGFALGEAFNAGPRHNAMILVDVRSASREALARADFDYTPELMGRCATFEQTVWSPHGSEKWTIRVLPGPGIGEKSYVTTSSVGGAEVNVGLRVLAGTVSLDLGFNLGPMTEEEGLDEMSQIAREFVEATEKTTS